MSSAIILAAGSSERMGRPKALIEWRGETFLARIARVLREGGVTSIAVVVGGAHRPEVEAAARALDPSVTILENHAPEEGPVESVRIGLASFPDAPFLLCQPVDIPGIEADDVAAILEAEAEADLVVPSVEFRRGHPLRIGTRARSLLLGDPARYPTVRRLFGEPSLRLLHVERTNRGLLRDFDTPEDLDQLE